MAKNERGILAIKGDHSSVYCFQETTQKSDPTSPNIWKRFMTFDFQQPCP
jgi:hypothetical protein